MTKGELIEKLKKELPKGKDLYGQPVYAKSYVIDEIIEFAYKMCELQKIECLQNAEIERKKYETDDSINGSSILNCKNVVYDKY